MKRFQLMVVASLCLLAVSCSKKKKAAGEEQPDLRYYSIREFILDQWKTHHGQPYTLERISVLNGKRDSSLVSAFDLDWASVFRIFSATDISDAKYLGRYRYSELQDDATQSIILVYDAADEKLYTRTLQIAADQFTYKIRNIYIETRQQNGLEKRTQKLYYSPVKLLQIQEFNSSPALPGKELRLEYRFM